MPKFIIKVSTSATQIPSSDDICCFVLPVSWSEADLSAFASADKMVLLEGDGAPALCKKLNFDGVLLNVSPDQPVKKQVLPVREAIGKKKVLGTVIVPSRHQAMLVSETEPEFVAFRFDEAQRDSALDVIRWYNELFLIQSAVDFSTQLQEFAAFDTDFVIISAQDYNILVAKNKSLD